MKFINRFNIQKRLFFLIMFCAWIFPVTTLAASAGIQKIWLWSQEDHFLWEWIKYQMLILRKCQNDKSFDTWCRAQLFASSTGRSCGCRPRRLLNAGVVTSLGPPPGGSPLGAKSPPPTAGVLWLALRGRVPNFGVEFPRWAKRLLASTALPRPSARRASWFARMASGLGVKV